MKILRNALMALIVLVLGVLTVASAFAAPSVDTDLTELTFVAGEEFNVTVDVSGVTGTLSEPEKDGLDFPVNIAVVDNKLTLSMAATQTQGLVAGNKMYDDFTIILEDSEGSVEVPVVIFRELSLIIKDINIGCDPSNDCDNEDDIEDLDFESDLSERLTIFKGGSVGSVDVKPGTVITLEIELENVFEDFNDGELEIDVSTFTITMDEFDEEGDVDEDCDTELDEGDKVTCTVEFEIPYNVDEGDSQTLEVRVSAKDVDPDLDSSSDRYFEQSYSFNFDIEFSIDKDSDEFRLEALNLNPGTAQCGGTFSITPVIRNIGSNDADVDLRITSSELDINIEETLLDVPEEEGDDDGLVRKSYTATVPEDFSTSRPSITAIITFDDGRDNDEITETLNVVCNDEDDNSQSNSRDDEDDDDNSSNNDNGVIIVDNTPTQNTQPEGQATGVPASGREVGTEGEFRQSNNYTILLVVLVVVALLILIVLGTLLLRK